VKFACQSGDTHFIVAPVFGHSYSLLTAGYAPATLGSLTPILTTTGVSISAEPRVAINYAVPSLELEPNICDIILSTGK